MNTRWHPGKTLLAALCAAPWAWLICLAAFVSAVTWKVGHFPAYSRPDPKHVEGLSELYVLTMILLMLAVLSPLVVGAHQAWASAWAREQQMESRAAAVYVLGVALSAFVLFGNAFGLSSWLFD